MTPLVLVYPDPPRASLTAALLESGYRPIPVESVEDAEARTPDDGWHAAVVEVGPNGSTAFAFCRRLTQSGARPPLLLVVDRDDLKELQTVVTLHDDFVLTPLDTRELEARLAALLLRSGRSAAPDLVRYQSLTLNLETYQALLGDRVLDLTYMEYELLRFFVTHPARVHTREVLLNRVWGYAYYGGARTVDVHVRRLRAKLGEEHASWIQTVRSVGYRLGTR